MKKITYWLIATLIILISIITIYLSTIGIETNKFNSRISDKINKINKNLNIELKKVSIILNPLKFEINAKTVGADFIYKNKIIKTESIKTNISLKSLIEGSFSIEKVNLSTKSIDVKNLLSFIHLFKKDLKILMAKQFIKNGYVVADIQLQFNELGKIKDNYKIKGLVKDGKINLLEKYKLNKIDFIFKIEGDTFEFSDLRFTINDKNLLAPQIKLEKKNDSILVFGKLNNKNIILNKKDITEFFGASIFGLDIQKVVFNSENNFSFRLNKKLKMYDLKINSKLNLENIILINNVDLKKFFPKAKKEILLKNHLVQLDYSNDKINITGSGDILFQNNYDKLEYKISKNKDKTLLETEVIISNNLFNINLINYKKNKNSNLTLNVKAKKENQKDLIFERIILKERKNIIDIKNINLSKNYKINGIDYINFDYLDGENLKNEINLIKKDKIYFVNGNSLNINMIIDNLLKFNDKKKIEIFNNDLKLIFDIDKVYLDKKNIIKDFKGSLFLEDNKIAELDLESIFSDNKNIKLTIRSKGDEKITTLYSDKAKPLVNRYDFIKGFNEGSLDFYSVKKENIAKSILKINDFKLKKLPVLTKVLTLASLQGIADLLSGEGIRFNEFEMKFTNDQNSTKIEEIYAIGPAISILMSGYIDKSKLISLRGTLVPATTINKSIGAIPFLGDILVGSKVGEGVFGVSFKIKGYSKNLETTVNPIKTLTPRFITRTLEKIKKTK
jgi:hypothetical protein